MNQLQYELLLKDVSEFNQYRQDNPNVNIDLSNADLSYVNLSYANLYNTNLYYVDLYNANLSKANLSKADLRNAYLCYADLRKANLSNTSLYDANMYKAYLYKANLCCANLSNANLRNANLFNADLSNTNFENAIIPCMKFDYRGYVLHIKYDKELRFIAGCRDFTFEEAINHWSSNDYPDKTIGRLYVSNINKIMQDYNNGVLIYKGKQNE